MSVKFCVTVAFAASLAACSQGGPAQTPAPAESAATPGAAAPADAAAAPDAAGAPATSAPPAGPASEAATPAGQAQRPARATNPPAAARSEREPVSSPQPAEPPPPPKPRFREVTIPAGTSLKVRLATSLASDTSKVEDQVRGTLTDDIVVDGMVAVPAGTEVTGTVRDAKRSGRVKGRASITFQFERLTARDETHAIRTAPVVREAEADRSDDVKKGAVGGAAGAIVGGILGGAKGAAIGAGAGAGGAVMATRGDELRLPAGTIVTTTLRSAVDVVVPIED